MTTVFCPRCDNFHELNNCPSSFMASGPEQQPHLPIVYLREMDAGTDNACWVVCNRVDDGSRAFVLLHQKMPVRPEVMEFAQAMEAKLRKNDHKQGWRTYPISALRRLLGIEVSELDVALDFDIGLDAPSECVDIANFSMMLRDRLNKDKKP